MLVGRSLGIVLVVMVSFAIFGGIDDYMGVRGVRRGEGMRGRTKAIIQLVIATIAALVMNQAHVPEFGPAGVTWSPEPLFGYSRVGIPGLAEPVDIGLLWVPIAIFIIHASANAVNLTDGLDGLAALICFVSFIVYGVIGYMQGQVFVTTFCMVIAGALLGFLWFNVHPAQIFMGDLGSEALGASLGMMALMTGQWLLLPIIAIVLSPRPSARCSRWPGSNTPGGAMARDGACSRWPRYTIITLCRAGARRSWCSASGWLALSPAWSG